MWDSQADQKSHRDKHCKERQFKIGQQVLVQNYRGEPRWVPGTIIVRTGPVSYQIKVGDQVWRCHTDQLLLSGSIIINPTEVTWDESYLFGRNIPRPTTESSMRRPVEPVSSSGSRRYPDRVRNHLTDTNDLL